MSDEKKNSKKELKLALLSLSNLVNTKAGNLFNVSKGSEQVLALLRWSAKSDDIDVNLAFLKVGHYLSSAHKRFFESNGVVFSALADQEAKTVDVTYRGQVIKKEAATTSVSESQPADDSKKGKRKIIYRGQEKWV